MLLAMPKPQFKEVPRDHAELDAHHMLTFKHAAPWWLRSKLHETQFTVQDFVHDVRERTYRAVKRTAPQHASVIKSRHIFANALGYRIAKESATRAKPGYGMESFADFLRGNCAYASRQEHIALPEGDPQFASYGEMRPNKSGEGFLKIIKMNRQEQGCMRWLGKEGGMEAVLGDDELWKYREASEEASFILYAPQYRRNMFEIVDPLDEFKIYENDWRDKCFEASVGQIETMRGAGIHSDLVALNIEDDALEMPVDTLIQQKLQPLLNDETAKRQLLSYLEFACIQKTEEKNYDYLKRLIDLWRDIATSLNIAPNERPIIGVLQILVHASTGNKDAIMRLLGPKNSHR